MIEVTMGAWERGALESVFGSQVEGVGPSGFELGAILMPFGWKEGDEVRIVDHQCRALQDRWFERETAAGRKAAGWALRRIEGAGVPMFAFEVMVSQEGE